jgi:peptidyl-prolyl cis-trans isomerase D
MATLQKIRSKAVLLSLIIGLALFAFIIGDFLNSGSSLFRQSQQKIAVIGESSLDYKEYEARIQEMQDVYKIQSGQSNFDDAIAGQIRESVFQTIVRERLLDEQAAALGVSVTGKEVFNMINGPKIHPMIQQLPIFQNPKTGGFDRSMMMNFLQTIELEDLSSYPQDAQEQIKNLKSYWMFWENNLKYTRLEEKINTLLTSAVKANSLDAETLFNERSLNVDFEYVFKPYTSVPDSLYKVSVRDIKKRYSAEKERFAQTPYRSAKYVVVDVKASKEDYKAVEEKIMSLKSDFITVNDPGAFVNANSDEPFVDCYVANNSFNPTVKEFLSHGSAGSFMEPIFADNVYMMARVIGTTVASDSVKARQIVLPKGAQAKADSLLAVIQKGGDFAALSAKYSTNGGSNPEMGWFREVDATVMGTEFLNACFNSSVNSIFSVKTKYGISIVQITGKSKPVQKSKVALLSIKLTPSSQTYGNVYNELNKVVAENQNAEKFFKAAAKAGYEVLTAQYVRKNDLTLAEIPQMRQAVRFVFNGQKGDVSSVFENSSNQLVVAGITGISDGDYQTVEEVQQLLSKELINEQKGAQFAEEIASKKFNSLSEIAAAEKLKVDTAKFVNFSLKRITGIGEEPVLISSVVGAEKDKISFPVKGKNGVYVYVVVSKNKSQEIFNAKTEMSSYNANNMYRLMYQSFDAVKKASKVEDKRIRFY